MIKAGDKLIIVAEALEDERNGVVYVKLTSDSQSHMTMLTENCKKVPKEVYKRGNENGDKKQIMLDELSKESEMIITTAYLYAKNYVGYGEDITKTWTTAMEHKAIVEKVYNKGYADALKEIEEHKTGEWIFAYGTKGKDNVEKCSCCGSHWKEAIIYRTDTQEYLRTRLPYCPNCGAEMRGTDND